MFIPTSCITAPNWKPAQMSLTDEWLNKLWRIRTTKTASPKGYALYGSIYVMFLR